MLLKEQATFYAAVGACPDYSGVEHGPCVGLTKCRSFDFLYSFV